MTRAESLTATARRDERGSLTPELRAEGEAIRQGTAARVLRELLQPQWLIVIPLLLSFIAWIVPTGRSVERGFVVREPLTLRVVVVLLLCVLPVDFSESPV